MTRWLLLYTWLFIGYTLPTCAAKEAKWFTFSRSTDRLPWDASGAVVCALDAFHFDVSFTAKKTSKNNDFRWQLIAKEVDGWRESDVVASGMLDTTSIEATNPEEKDLSEATLRCELDPDFCEPKLIGIRLPDVDATVEGGKSLQLGHSLELEFQSATDRPDVTTKEGIDEIVVFTEYIGDELEGVWSTDGRVLVIRIINIDESRVKPVKELMQGLLQTRIRADEAEAMISVEGRQNLRIEPTGTYLIHIRARGGVSVWSPEMTVKYCESFHAVTYSGHAAEDLIDKVKLTEPSFSSDGIMTHGGNEGFVLLHDYVGMEKLGSWSLSFWVFLTQDATGSFRSLFFNGDGQHEQRTPSAWWKPDERRLVLRVSTNSSTDVGVDSTAEIPLNRWTHLGFTFVNCSQSGDDLDACPDSHKTGTSWTYSILFYVNGVLDTTARIHDTVVGNSGPLHVGQGPWTEGMQGFTSNLKVFSVPVSAAEYYEIYLSERFAHANYPEMDCQNNQNDSDIIPAAKVPTTQVSYLTQRFKCLSEVLDRTGEDDMSFIDLQTAAYKKAITAKDSCSEDTWDLFVEAADLGHPRTCQNVGEGYLYGSYGTRNNCITQTVVEQNLTRARTYLEKAFHAGEFAAGKPLALLLEMTKHDNRDARLSLFTTGMLHLSAATGQKDVFAMLGRRYHQTRPTNIVSVESASYHYYHAAVTASIDFHQLGKQPLHEMVRLYDSLERDLTVGERGDDDELIQFQKMRADQEGDVAAMAAMGDLYYWGAHGVPRDHSQAYQYFERAAQAGDVASQSAVAGMLLKGEGTAQDNSTAIEWYEKAAEKNHTRALNGLGFIHFHGSGGVPENKSLALEYFERAAANEEDGDSIFNAGYCHATGLGTAVNVTRAMRFYDLAARKFGHFDAIFEMGKLFELGVSGVVLRDSRRALGYLKAASEGGQWGSAMRKGFDLFVNGEYSRAVVFYHEAKELGYHVATSNLAFLYDQRLLQLGDEVSERRALAFLTLASEENGDKETLVRIGDFHYYGLAELPINLQSALRWYSRGSAAGIAAGAYNVGHMHEMGDGVATNFERAQRYYNRALELSSHSSEVYAAITFALTRLRLRKLFYQTPFEALLDVGDQSANGSAPGSMLGRDAATSFLNRSDVALRVVSAIAIVIISIGAWYLHSAQ